MTTDEMLKVESIVAEMQAEIERLRALIRELLYSIGHDRKELMDETADRARAALEGKP